MKNIINKLSKIQKINSILILLTMTIFLLLIGIIIIGASENKAELFSYQRRNIDISYNINGFSVLKTCSVGMIFKSDTIWQILGRWNIPGHPDLHGALYEKLTDLSTLKSGLIIIIIVTPIFATMTISWSLLLFIFKTK